MARYIFYTLLVLSIGLYFFLSNIMRTAQVLDFKGNIIFTIDEQPYSDSKSKLFLEAETKENMDWTDHYIVYDIKRDKNETEINILGIKKPGGGGIPEDEPATMTANVHLKEGDNILKINQGDKTDEYKIILSNNNIEIEFIKTSFSSPKSIKIERNLPLKTRFPNIQKDEDEQLKAIEEDPKNIRFIKKPYETIHS